MSEVKFKFSRDGDGAPPAGADADPDKLQHKTLAADNRSGHKPFEAGENVENADSYTDRGQHRQQAAESAANQDYHSHGGSKSSQRIRAETGVKLRFLEEQTRLKISQLQTDAKLQALELRMQAELAEVDSGDGVDVNVVDEQNLREERRQRTQDFVRDQPGFPFPPPPMFGSAGATSGDISCFLLKRELLLTRFQTFDDRPEFYHSWKATFISVVSDIGVTDHEEVDLLIKWLGPESKRQARSIQASSPNDPTSARLKIWQRLNERYGSPELVEASVRTRLAKFSRMGPRDNKKLYDFADLLSEILSLQKDPCSAAMLQYLDTSRGMKDIVCKLSYALQDRWTGRAVKYRTNNNGMFPPFSELVAFIHTESVTRNDPAFQYQEESRSTFDKPKATVNVHKSTVEPAGSQENDLPCIIHGSGHTLLQCKTFFSKPIWTRRKLLKENNVCYKCCNSTSHRINACSIQVKCNICDSEKHASILHVSDGGEGQQKVKEDNVDSKCTEVCGDNLQAGKSCAKIVSVNVYHEDNKSPKKLYALIDDQSNRTLASPKFFDMFNVDYAEEAYTLTSCAGTFASSGRRGRGFVVESIDGATKMNLPEIIECSEIPNNRAEIPSPQVAKSYPHLNSVCKFIPAIDNQSDILLLIGRDLIAAHRVLDQIAGEETLPIAQQLPLGWVIIGETCLGRQHVTPRVNVNKTFVLPNGQATLLPPCTSRLEVTETYLENKFEKQYPGIADSVIFEVTKNDNSPAASIDDLNFMKVMKEQYKLDQGGSWVAPLPFRSPREQLQNNRDQALKRAKLFDINLSKNSTKREHFLSFMQDVFDRSYAEEAEPLHRQECWYLPLFGVYHPKKPDRIRGVFDASAVYKGMSLNKALLQGPDLNNDLLGVLMRFRKERIGIMADIQSMFYGFKVREDHRDFLRFFWHRDNLFENELIEYRMKVHIFGNSPSPAVAIYGLHKSAELAQSEFGHEVTHFIKRNFYVDDGLTSCSSEEQAIDLLKKSQHALKKYGNLKLCKIASNSRTVTNAFEKEELSKELNIEISESLCTRSLGLKWDLKTDSFTFEIAEEEKAHTRRGLLAMVNSIFDPLGFAAPVTIKGKWLLRKLTSATFDWDDPLPPDIEREWNEWRKSLQALNDFQISRPMVGDLCSSVRNELLVYCDASELAIAAVAYLRSNDMNNEEKVGFIVGKSKVAPRSCHTIPRLELCAAVLAVELYKIIESNIDLSIESVTFYSDSRVVLGYIHNEKKRFFTYVANRVQKIRTVSSPHQWNYVPSELNPADSGTRSITAQNLQSSSWVAGPKKLSTVQSDSSFPIVDPSQDKEIRVSSNKTLTQDSKQLSTARFERFSSWSRLKRAVDRIKRYVAAKGAHFDIKQQSVSSLKEAEQVIVQAVQQEVFSHEINLLKKQKALPRSSQLRDLDPYIDEQGLLRVGGRLKKLEAETVFKQPIIIPGRHHVATLLIRHFHDLVLHQGRQLTEGRIRSAGFWIMGAKRLISSVLIKCISCRKLRAPLLYQKMADLPKVRLESCQPPFSYVGVDIFGPWEVVTRKTRGGAANSKRWGAMFTCLVSRAVHIEVVEEMSSSSFINALRRFEAIRGKVIEYHSDCGTNFVGAVDPLKFNVVNVEDKLVKKHLTSNETTWIFNPPHSSHMGGAWERMIGIARRILDSLLSSHKTALTHEVITTFLAEVTAIMNSRPLVPVCSDPESPIVLSPNLLLTQKLEPRSDEKLGEFDTKDLMRHQWKRVQYLASVFWDKWHKEYLDSLQSRVKWVDSQPNVSKGDVVLLKNSESPRRDWPMGIIVKVLPSDDGKVRRAEVRIVKNQKASTFFRPVTELVLLINAP